MLSSRTGVPVSKRPDAHESVSNGARAMDRLLEHRKPVSWYGLTPKGASATKAHLEALEELLQGAGQ